MKVVERVRVTSALSTHTHTAHIHTHSSRTLAYTMLSPQVGCKKVGAPCGCKRLCFAVISQGERSYSVAFGKLLALTYKMHYMWLRNDQQSEKKVW